VGVQVAASITDGYYDAGTTGQALGAQADGSVGMTTAQLQGTLPTFQNSGLWSTGPGLYPYLTNFFPNGAQAISGYAYSDAGKTAAAGSTVGAVAGGSAFGSASVGANGYYYIFAPAGSAASGATLLAYGSDAATLTTATGTTVQSSVNLYGQALTGVTSDITLSAALSDLTAAMTTAASGNSGALAAIAGATGADLTATGASFTVDQAVTTSGAFAVTTTAANAPITVSDAVTINGAGGLVLDAAGALAINAPITVTGSGSASLAAGGGYGFGFTGSGFAGGLSFASESSAPSLTIDGQTYTLVYSMTELASDLNASTGDFALAGALTPGAGYTGAVVGSFGGTFAGLGNTISGLSITGSSGKAGLFGALIGAGEIRDLGLVGGSVAGGSEVGALVGDADGLIINVYSTASVSGTSDVGGLAGYNASTGTLSNDATNGATITGTLIAGGLVGKNAGTIQQASSSDTVSGGKYLGGVAGYTTGTITGASATGSVTGSGSVQALLGGLAGYNDGDISASSAGGAVSASGSAPFDLGGLVGENGTSGDITTSQAAGGSVSAPGGVGLGGLVGVNEGQISQSFATESVGANGTGDHLGGLVGYNAAGATITDTYATGQVEAGTYIGGLIGDNGGSVLTSWASGPVAAGDTSGGIAGADKAGGVLTNLYWDVGTTGLAAAIGKVNLGTSTNVTAVGNNPDAQATYTGFNFSSVWTINPGTSRPYLRNVSPQTPPN